MNFILLIINPLYNSLIINEIKFTRIILIYNALGILHGKRGYYTPLTNPKTTPKLLSAIAVLYSAVRNTISVIHNGFIVTKTTSYTRNV